MALKVRARGQEYDRFKARRALANQRPPAGAASAAAKRAQPSSKGGDEDVQVRRLDAAEELIGLCRGTMLNDGSCLARCGDFHAA